MKKSKRYNSTLGKLFFIIPAALIVILVVYAFVQLNSPGTLIVSAEACLKGQTGDCSQLNVPATVNGRTGTTPWTLSLPEGNYAVNFTTIEWFYPASAHDVSIVPGTTAYAVAVYTPIGKVIQVEPTGFNVTSIAVLHDVTPVNWTNPSGSIVTFSGAPFGTVSLEPGQTLSYTYNETGTYSYTIFSTDYSMTVEVS